MIDRMSKPPLPAASSPVHSQAELARMACRQIRHHQALPLAQVMAQVAEMPPWQYHNGRLCLRRKFPDYAETRQFVDGVATIADQEDHHPLIEFGYNHAVIWFDTHDVNGISIKDFVCAAKVSDLA
jgi:4a-hydroxytetrahydrobiopterin dehydratase